MKRRNACAPRFSSYSEKSGGSKLIGIGTMSKSRMITAMTSYVCLRLGTEWHSEKKRKLNANLPKQDLHQAAPPSSTVTEERFREVRSLWWREKKALGRYRQHPMMKADRFDYGASRAMQPREGTVDRLPGVPSRSNSLPSWRTAGP